MKTYISFLLLALVYTGSLHAVILEDPSSAEGDFSTGGELTVGESLTVEEGVRIKGDSSTLSGLQVHSVPGVNLGKGRWIKVARIQNRLPIDAAESASFNGVAMIQSDYGRTANIQYQASFSFGSRGGDIIPMLNEFGDGWTHTAHRRIEWVVAKSPDGWHYLYLYQGAYSRFVQFIYRQTNCITYFEVVDTVPTEIVWRSSNFENPRQGFALGPLRAKNDGNLGVGVRNPTEKLQVDGVVESIEGGFKLPDGTVIDEASDLGNRSSLTTPSGDPAITVQNDGKVVVGNTNASHRFNIGGTAKIDGNAVIAGSDFTLGTNSGRSKGTKVRQRALVHGYNDNLIINYGGDFEGGVILSSDTTVNGILEAQKIVGKPLGEAAAYGGTFYSDANGRAVQILSNDYDYWAKVGEALAFNFDTTNQTVLIQSTQNGKSQSSNISLQPTGGKIGIGTTTPEEKLHVAGNAKIDGNIDVSGVLKVAELELTRTYGDIPSFNANP